MVKIIMHGCGGKMGHVVSSIVANDENCEIVAGVDPRDVEMGYPVFKNIDDCNIEADCIIDFSTASAVPALLEYSKSKNIPVVLCSTGLSEELNNKVLEYSKHVAILKSANMSVGVNLIMKVLKELAPVLAEEGFDIEIVEKHHNQKIDAPSGTAIALADAMNEEFNNEYKYVFDRSQVREKRSQKEIGISAVRGGTIVGDHDVIFAGRDEVITVSHTAYSKELFAVGAVKAAKYLAGKPAGFYTMKNVME